jgi:AraC-like DNA-binding protein
LTAAAREAYRTRFRKVLEHIDAQLDEELSGERLSGVAAFSKYHFHRQFSALFGIGVFKYVQLVRLRRASYQLAFRPSSRILDVALGSGYDSHERSRAPSSGSSARRRPSSGSTQRGSLGTRPTNPSPSSGGGTCSPPTAPRT